MTANQYLTFMEGVRRYGEPCKHGHYDCSITEGGPCCDEEYANLSDEQRKIVDDHYS
jgi:hypothetical protein